jgi:3-hydroxy-3-methylglutaryl CoA synthase
MIEELKGLPHPDGGDGTLLDAIDMIVPHQANKTMVIQLAERAGLTADQLYFNIERVGNTSSASIPLAIHDAVRDGVIRQPVRIFAPGFGAGAVAGYAVLRVDPAIVAVEEPAARGQADAAPGEDARSAGEAGGASTSEDVQVAFT